MILKQLRKEKKLTQQRVADYVGVTQAAYSGWENEKYEIDKQSLLKLSELFNVSTDYLLGLSNEKHRTIKVMDIDNILEDNKDEIFNVESKMHPAQKEQGAQKMYDKLVEIGFLESGEEVTEKHLEVLKEVLLPQSEFFRFKLNGDK